ncbi:GNAT family N-acetyltransferase [Demequina flava]|uniref:GNAT family N-acetyltransferase n=1 Tax=Demequina flava TaxID=1095025 RepID=UPI0007834339|nr:GNAT family N-acetyltransferase [Demequina flava]
MSEQQATTVRNDDAARYEYRADRDVLGYIDFRLEGDATVLVHTEVPEEFRGTGIARELAAGALKDLAYRDAVVVPVCPYLARYLHRCESCEVEVRWPQR